MARKRTKTGVTVDSTVHKNAKRSNIPTAELEAFAEKRDKQPKTLLYPRDSSLDPQLVWKGKDDQDRSDLAVPVVPIYIQEKIHPRYLVEELRAEQSRRGPQAQIDLFSDFNGLELEKLVDFYQHPMKWQNRMILGDSLLVMASLAEKEGLKGKVQMIYLDPPYGIKFGSNWQVSTRKRDVRDGKADDATRQPEQIRAFRDTWELGIHSYLSYLRERFTVASDLLSDSGSLFVQIGLDNVHLVRSILDEVFGSDNLMSMIAFRKTTTQAGDFLPDTNDYLLWYAKSRESAKYRVLYSSREGTDWVNYDYVRLPNGDYRRMTTSERDNPDQLPLGSRVYRRSPLTSASSSATTLMPVEFQNATYRPE